MGHAFIVPGADYRANNLGAVTPTGNIPIQGIAVVGSASVYVTAKYTAAFVPTFTTQRSVVWSITSGSEYASIDQNGVLTGVPEIENKSVTIRCTSSYDNTIYGEKTVVVTTADLVYYDWLSSDGTDFVITSGLHEKYNVKAVAKCKHSGTNTYVFECMYQENSTVARMAAYNNSSSKVSALVGAAGYKNYTTMSGTVKYRYEFNVGASGGGDSSCYVYNDADNTQIGSTTSTNICLSGIFHIMRAGVGAANIDPQYTEPYLTPAGAKFYGLKVTDTANGDAVLAEIKPCIYHGMPGVYDTVADAFYGGYLGTGGLTVGND